MSAESVDVYGEPNQWPYRTVGDLDTSEMIRVCPQCGALTLNPWQHKDWHVQFDKTKT